MKNTLNRIEQYFFTILIIYLPFSELLVNILERHTYLSTSIIFWTTRWYFFAAIVLFLITIYSIFKNRQIISEEIVYAGSLLLLGLLSVFYAPSIYQGIEGFRITLFGVVFYLIARNSKIEPTNIKKIVNTYLIMACAVVFWALLERFLPLRYWSHWGIINQNVLFGYGWHAAGNLMQSASFIGGPNQLASYLLPAFFLLVSHINFKNKKNAYLYLGLSILFAVIIFLTSSRSALIGGIVGLVTLICLQKNKKIRTISLFALGAVVLLVFWILISNAHLKELLTHGASQAEHIKSLVVTLLELKERLFNYPIILLIGAGVGTAGPIAIKYGGIVSESWYLQLLLELGLSGLVFCLLFFYSLAKKLWENNRQGLFFGFISVIVTMLFLHTLSDNPALSYSLFGLIGLSINKESNG